MEFLMVRINKPFFRLLLSIFFPLFFLFIVACEEDPTDIDINFKPVSKLNIYFSDTLQVKAFTYSQDSIRADETIYNLLGTVHDPVFGTATASFLTQIRLSDKFYPGDNASVDSLILFFETNGLYGDSLAGMNMEVYQSFKTIYLDSMYYSNFNLSDSIGTVPLGVQNYTPVDSVIKVYLDPGFGDWLISDTSALVSQSAFQNHFKGFYVSSKETFAGSGGITRIDLLSLGSKLALYYRNSETDSLSYDFDINTYAARVNLFEHDFSTADEATKIQHLNDHVEDSVVYVQGIAGVYTKFALPYLSVWKDSMPLAVNHAEFVINIYDEFSNQVFPSAEEFDLLIKNQEGNYERLIDSYFGDEYFGGQLNDSIVKFTVTTQIQDYLEDKKEQNEFYLLVKNQEYIPNRSVFTSPINSNRLKFRFTYTRIKE